MPPELVWSRYAHTGIPSAPVVTETPWPAVNVVGSTVSVADDTQAASRHLAKRGVRSVERYHAMNGRPSAPTVIDGVKRLEVSVVTVVSTFPALQPVLPHFTTFIAKDDMSP